MTAKTISAAVAVILAVAGLLFFRGSWQCKNGTWTMVGHSLSRHPQTACVAAPIPPKVCSPAWSCGQLAWGEAGMKPGTWYLKYDDTTGPTMLKIAFIDGALCHVDDIVAACAKMNPPSGSTSSFRGNKDGEFFRVSSLDFTTKK